MTGRVKVGVPLCIAVILSVGGALWLNRPFQVELGSYRTSLADRTEAQRHNIRRAVMALDGIVIEPGDVFSFNDVVGPRTPERGYREALAFMERDLVKSIGGGICQVSSTLYNAAALSGMAIVERHSHFRQVSSVPPGRDATVWYGMADLRFRNLLPTTIRLSLRLEDETLLAVVQSRHESQRYVRIVSYVPSISRPGSVCYHTIRVTEMSEKAPHQESLSVDVYKRYQ